ncbi:serine C-palmitoyltransferase LCB2 [Ascoidea rubescens DSM 1968]|uniref:serine C-palmitoyltransferase n=1 Tax=Ascoidea rubescens DSM 1968 TaxID=1344418 RepID=A0A1D2VFP7_9ASCO|nr:PLP-dependent transferase [Ascoidea rubescens DSM 1968]ODV60498.1 PLP-dependent transferase [Ascoidea rubescens DSM 1968]
MMLTDEIPNIEINKDLSHQQKVDKEYGPLESDEFLYLSQYDNLIAFESPPIEEPPYLTTFLTYLNYLILIIIGHFKDFFGILLTPNDFSDVLEKDGHAPYYSKFESFYVRRLKTRIDDGFSRPTVGVPGRYITCIDRYSSNYNKTFQYTNETTTCLNLSSYNYLGFAQSQGQCTDFSLEALNAYGTGSGGPRNQIGSTDLHQKCEAIVADFVGKEDAILFSMGYATNANLFTSLLNPNCLVLSDELNHASIRFGVRLSGATVKTFKHNDMKDLENIIREQISQGQPKIHRPWKKILIVVEGIYSMEGTMCNLPQLINLKKKYKLYLFVDEAHSIGAIGPKGRGVCDYFNVNPNDVDILMGTLTKSFGATGGYIAADKHIIDRLRIDIMTCSYAESIASPILAQIISSLKTITGEINPGEGEERLRRIAFNSRYLRFGLRKLGFIVYGMDDSPIIPLLLYIPNKMPAITRSLYKRGIAVVIVSYPATPIIASRVRFCVSSSLTKSDLDRILSEMDYFGDKYYIKYAKGKHNDEPFDDKPNATLTMFDKSTY